MPATTLDLEHTFAALPPPRPEDLRRPIRAALEAHSGPKLVVLDDDPTGTQTVYDVPVLTTWGIETLRHEFALAGHCFYVLTNSRSLAPSEAAERMREIARNLAVASSGRRYTVVSRSDSTLRGHFPLETDVLATELGTSRRPANSLASCSSIYLGPSLVLKCRANSSNDLNLIREAASRCRT